VNFYFFILEKYTEGTVMPLYIKSISPKSLKITDNSVWVSDGSGKKNFIWEGLKPGTIVWFRVIAVGSGNKRLTSDAVSCMVI
jgi:hypothetical protein